MKLVLLILLTVLTKPVSGQFVTYSYSYPSDSVAHQIIIGKAKHFLSDTINIQTVKKDKLYTRQSTIDQINKIMKKGHPYYGGRTNGGLAFSIFVENPKTEKLTDIISFRVNIDTRKIDYIEFTKFEN